MSVSAPQKVVFVLTVCLLACTFAQSISAQTNSPQKGTIEVEPAYLEVTLTDGDEEEAVDIYYTNHSTKPLSLEMFPVDFKQASERGGISFLGKEANTYSYSLSSFLTFEANQILVEPGEKRKFTLRVTNRQDLSPGGHYAAVVARLVSESQQAAVVAPAISSLVFMKKMGGESFHLSINDLDWPKNLIAFRIPSRTDVVFQNEGNVHVVPYGKAEMKDLFGRVLYTGIVNSSSAIIMPETRRLIPIELKKMNYVYPLSFIIFTLTGEDSLKKVRYSYQETFIYIHPAMLGFIPLVMFGLWSGYRRVKGNGLRGKKMIIVTPEVSPSQLESNTPMKKQTRKKSKKKNQNIKN